MKAKLFTAIFLLALDFSAQAALFIYGGGDAAIPDNSAIGLIETLNPSGLGTSVSTVTLNFMLAGGYGTDLSGYLRLGNLSGSQSYSLNSLVRADSTISSSGVTFNVDVSSAFNRDNPNDTWTLFFADTSPGDTTMLKNGWNLDISAVPEPVNTALAVFGLMLIVTGIIHSFRKRKNIFI